jgi:autotransporter-associated beta strand protein
MPLRHSSIAFLCLAAGSISHAADGTFGQTTAGTYSWDVPGNWASGGVADGSGFTAHLTSGATGNYVITLDGPRTIGRIVSTNHAWTIQGPNALTLAGGTTPILQGPTQGLFVSASIAGSQGLTTLGTVSLSGSNTYSGVTTFGATGTISSVTVSHANALGANGAGNTTTVTNGSQLAVHDATITGETITINGGGAGTNNGSLQGRGTSTWAGDVVLGNGSSRIGTYDAASQLTVSGVISGGQALFISGLGTTVLSGSSTYTGATTIYRGTLKLDGGNNRLPTGTVLTMGQTSENSTFDLNGWNQQLSGLANSTNTSSRTVTNTSATASILTLNGSTTRNFTGEGDTSITGNLSLVKAGSYSQTLAETNSYRGNTTINAGTLVLADDATMTFYIGANGVNNSILGTGSITLNGDFVFNLDSAVLVANNSWTIVNVVTLSETYGSTFTVQGFTETVPDSGIWNSGNLSFSEATGVLSVVPEPGSAALLIGSLTGLCLFRRRVARP